MRYMPKEMLPRNTNEGYDKKCRSVGEKWIAKMNSQEPTSGIAQAYSPLVRMITRNDTVAGKKQVSPSYEESRPCRQFNTTFRGIGRDKQSNEGQHHRPTVPDKAE